MISSLFRVLEMFGLIGKSILAQIWDITNDCESSERYATDDFYRDASVCEYRI